MSDFFDQTFNEFGVNAGDPIRMDPAATQAWRDGTPLPDLSTASQTIARAGSSAGISGTSAPSAPASSGSVAAPASFGGNASGGVGPYLVRGVVIVLGFVFVGVGLTMFKPNAILEKVTS